MFPSIVEIELLHKKCAPTNEAFHLVWTHSLIVKEIAESIIVNKSLSLNKELAIAGALLHDIGAYKLIKSNGDFDGPNYIRHGIEGYEILKAENFSDELCNITIHHTGVGLTKEDIVSQQLPLPPDNYMAETIEEKLVMYADKFHSKTPAFNSFASYEQYVKKYGEDKVVKFHQFAELFGIPDLKPLSEKYHHPIR